MPYTIACDSCVKYIFLDFRGDIHIGFQGFTQIGNFVPRLVWHFIHLLVRFWYLGVVVANVIESCLNYSGLLKRYKAIDVGKLQYLAIVVETRE